MVAPTRIISQYVLIITYNATATNEYGRIDTYKIKSQLFYT